MDHTAVTVAVIGLRAALPLAIFRLPLPAVLASLVLDAVDQTVFDAYGSEPASYEAYDKAMDTYYLALAYLSILRNWSSVPAARIGRALFLVRLAGVVAFELWPWPPLLFLAANTFEYYFIGYELVRTRWDPGTVRTRSWVATAAALWIVVKLPQEWWLHVAHLDVTAAVGAHPLVGLAVGGTIAGLALAGWLTRHRVLPRPAHPLSLAADHPPSEVDDPDEQAWWRAQHGRWWAWPTVEKVLLTTMLVVVFGQVLPGTTATGLQLLAASTVVVVLNSALTLTAARHGWRVRSWWGPIVVRGAVNVTLVGVIEAVASPFAAEVGAGHLLVFLGLLTVVGATHDRYYPVYDYRVHRERAVSGSTSAASSRRP